MFAPMMLGKAELDLMAGHLPHSDPHCSKAESCLGMTTIELHQSHILRTYHCHLLTPSCLQYSTTS